MHVQSKWAISETEMLTDFISSYGFAVLFDKHLEASHAPLVLENRSNGLVLTGHLPRNNPMLKTLDGSEVLVIFNGPHSYISPYWYGESPAVPTWNYAAVHVKGRAKILDEADTLASLDVLLRKYEPRLLEDKIMYPDTYRDKLIKGICGIEIEINSIQGKEKLGQHKNQEVQKGTVSGLENSEDLDAKSLLAYMQRRDIGLG